jgi:glycosyltransferase involved in cell wall biosynthesis
VKVVAVSWRDLAHPSAGGAEVLVDRLLTGLAERGHEVALVCGGPVGRRSYEVVDAGGTYSQYIKAPWVCATRFRNADVIVDAENGIPYFSPIWRHGPSVCLVHHVHTNQWHQRFPPPIAVICRQIEHQVMPAVYRKRLFVAVSQSTASALRQIGVTNDHIRVVESGVDVPTATPVPKSDDPLFVSMNRLVPHTRLDALLESWRIAARSLAGRLVLAGDGPELDHLRRLASSMPRVDVLGRVSNEQKQELLARAWAVVSTSHHEGWGMSLMEGAAVGTPAVAVDVPGIRDAIDHMVTGMLVQDDDEHLPEVFGKALIHFANDNRRRLAMGEAARERAIQHSWERSVNSWELVLHEAVELTSSARGGKCVTPAGFGSERENDGTRVLV